MNTVAIYRLDGAGASQLIWRESDLSWRFPSTDLPNREAGPIRFLEWSTNTGGGISKTVKVEKKSPPPDGGGEVIRKLAELPSQAQVDCEALGLMLGRCKKSVQRAVRRGELPPPFRFMGKHVWLVNTVLKHMQLQQNAALQEASKRAARIDKQRL